MGIYFDQNKKMVFDCRDGSKVINNNCPTYTGLFNFDGAAYIVLHPGNTGNIIGNKTVKWNMWLDSDSGYTTCQVFCFWSSILANVCYVGLSNDQIIVGGERLYPYTMPKFPLSGFSQTILQCELKKTSAGLTYFKINGNTQTSSGTSSFGGNVDAWGIALSSPALSKGTIWDISVIDDDSTTETDRFIGHPAGNTNAAWINTHGSYAANITNPNGTGTRDI